jgi:hypothetical protein
LCLYSVLFSCNLNSHFHSIYFFQILLPPFPFPNILFLVMYVRMVFMKQKQHIRSFRQKPATAFVNEVLFEVKDFYISRFIDY